MNFDTRASIRSLQNHARSGHGLPFIIEYEGELAGQLKLLGVPAQAGGDATLADALVGGA